MALSIDTWQYSVSRMYVTMEDRPKWQTCWWKMHGTHLRGSRKLSSEFHRLTSTGATAEMKSCFLPVSKHPDSGEGRASLHRGRMQSGFSTITRGHIPTMSAGFSRSRRIYIPLPALRPTHKYPTFEIRLPLGQCLSGCFSRAFQIGILYRSDQLARVIIPGSHPEFTSTINSTYGTQSRGG